MQVLRNRKIGALLVAAVLLLVFWFALYNVYSPSWAQPTMGTVCHITISGRVPGMRLSRLREEIDERLEEVNHCMSAWDPNSEISLFNRSPSVEMFSVSSELEKVMRSALDISKRTGGAFDPSVKPLVDYWGFGPEERTESLEETRQRVGWKELFVWPGSIQKRLPGMEVDLSAIAKGYGVDSVADVIQSAGFSSFLVEIGGEIRAEGLNPEKKPWRVGIESPLPGTGFGDEIYRTVTLSDAALATSGGYRNFRVRDDKSVYSHIINPATGMPAESDVASVSVIAPSCMEADAVATALFVMGSEKGLSWAEAYQEIEAHFILHSTNQTFTSCLTSGFPAE